MIPLVEVELKKCLKEFKLKEVRMLSKLIIHFVLPIYALQKCQTGACYKIEEIFFSWAVSNVTATAYVLKSIEAI